MPSTGPIILLLLAACIYFHNLQYHRKFSSSVEICHQGMERSSTGQLPLLPLVQCTIHMRVTQLRLIIEQAGICTPCIFSNKCLEVA